MRSWGSARGCGVATCGVADGLGVADAWAVGEDLWPSVSAAVDEVGGDSAAELWLPRRTNGRRGRRTTTRPGAARRPRRPEARARGRPPPTREVPRPGCRRPSLPA